MISVNMSTLWSDETDKIIECISEVTENIKMYRKFSEHLPDKLVELGDGIEKICRFWTGRTYVGSPKKEEIKKAFQSFFEELMKLLLDMKVSKLDFENRVANALLYRGIVYRYLGHNYSTDEVVVPNYDNIYVSWNKEEKNDYLLSKLHGPVTKMICEIAEPLYGIDLESLGCCRGLEREVVFPTVEKYVTEIKYPDGDRRNV